MQSSRKTLIIARHPQARPRVGDDEFGRSPTEHGIAQSKARRDQLGLRLQEGDLVVASPAYRAQYIAATLAGRVCCDALYTELFGDEDPTSEYQKLLDAMFEKFGYRTIADAWGNPAIASEAELAAFNRFTRDAGDLLLELLEEMDGNTLVVGCHAVWSPGIANYILGGENPTMLNLDMVESGVIILEVEIDHDTGDYRAQLVAVHNDVLVQTPVEV